MESQTPLPHTQSNKINLIRINLSEDDLPVMKEVKSQNVVLFGKDNQYPDKLLEYFNNSTFHGAIVSRKADFIAGGGIEFNEKLPPNERAIVERYIKRPNAYMDLETLIHRDALQLALFNSIPHQIAWRNDGKGFDVYYLPFERVRANKDCTLLYYKEKWTAGGGQIMDNEKYKPYNTSERIGTQINYFRMFRPGMDTYPLPEYISATKAIAIDCKIPTFHNANLDNGFAAGTMIEIVTGPVTDPDTKDKIERKLKKKVGGPENGGQILLNFIEQENQKSNVVQLSGNDLDKRFQQLYDQARDAIFSGHGVTSPTLFGIATPGQLGQRQEMLDAYELMFATYVERRQRAIEALHNGYLRAMGVSDPGLKIKKSQPMSWDVKTLLEMNLLSPEAAAARLGISPDEMPKAPIVPAAEPAPTPIKFSAIPEGYTPPEDADKWKDTDAEMFAQFGELEEEFETIAALDHDWLDEKHTFSFASIDEIQAKILDLIAKNEKIDISQLADVTKMDVKDLSDIVSKLAEKGLLKTADSGGGGLVITPDGSVAVKDYGKEFRQVFVKYKYNGPKDSKNRPFCAQMLSMGRIYSRAEIDKLSALLGYNVWQRRGGWYTVPNSEPPLHLPYCRHTWSQQIVRRKIG